METMKKTMKTTEKIAIMQAWCDGKQIQFKSGMDSWINWRMMVEPTWNWDKYEYRIKPEPKEPTYRPYKDFAEFRAEWKKHGGWANDKCNSNRRLIEAYNDEFAETLLTYYTWADDGTPCGIKLED